MFSATKATKYVMELRTAPSASTHEELVANPCCARKVGGGQIPAPRITLEVKLGLPLLMLGGGGSIDTHFGSEVGIASASTDPGGMIIQ